jgi:hypothetical protein
MSSSRSASSLLSRKSKSPQGPSKSKTVKNKRQTKMTEYYRNKRKVPTFHEIYQNRTIFPDTKNTRDKWKTFVESLHNLKEDRNSDKIILFYADSEDLEDEYDNENMLDIHKSLTKAYFDKLYKGHLKWLKKQKYDFDYDIYYETSYGNFNKLKRLPSAFVKYVEGKLDAKHLLTKNYLPEVLSDYAVSFVIRDESYEKKMAPKNKTRKSSK